MKILARPPARLLRRLAVSLALVFACTALSRVASAAGSAYLTDMPTPEQVVGAIQGNDPVDTTVRQVEAFGQLCWVIRIMSQGGEFGNNETPEEMAQCALYNQASVLVSKRASGLLAGLPAHGSQSWVMRTQHYHDEGFRTEVLSHFPKLLADYEARKVSNFIANSRGASREAGFGPLGTGILALIFGVVGIATFVVAARVGGGARAGKSRERVIVRTIDGASTNLVPHDPGLAVENLCIGAIDVHYTYTAPVNVSVIAGAPTVTGGGTQGGSYMVYDFGCAVHNRSAAAVRFQITLAEVDGQGYVLKSNHVWQDISPGEKRRIWAGRRFNESSDLARCILKEIGFGPTPADSREIARFTAKTSPNANLFDAFDLGRAPLKTSKVSGVAAASGYLLMIMAGVMILLAILFGIIASLSLYR